MTVTIMSIAFVTILEGQAVFFHSTTVRHATASLDTASRSYSTALNNAAYVDCAAAYAPVPRIRERPPQWRSTTGTATPRPRRSPIAATCLANGDQGVQRMQITMTDTATSQSDQLTIVKRKP